MEWNLLEGDGFFVSCVGGKLRCGEGSIPELAGGKCHGSELRLVHGVIVMVIDNCSNHFVVVESVVVVVWLV